MLRIKQKNIKSKDFHKYYKKQFKMGKFICKECGYKTDSASLEICPYCNKKSIEKEQDAEELIKEVEKILR